MKNKVQRSLMLFSMILILHTYGQAGLSQDKTVSGIVTSEEDGQPLPGVNVIEKGTTNGTVTNAEGSYSLNVSEDATLVFSSVGFTTEEVEVNNLSVIDLVMFPDIQQLQELVVVGYGEQEKRDITGAMSSVKSRDIENVPVANSALAIQGKVAGMDIVSNSGQPGSGTMIRIRGNRSITASNDPLIVLDGIPFAGNINDINPNDIASIEVLKDASATAIYGSRGANGVILVTSKRGAQGDAKISYNAYYGITEKYGEIRPRSREAYVQQRIDVAKFYDQYTSDEEVFADWEWENFQNGVNTYWLGYAFNEGYRQNHQLSASGGDDNTSYLVSANFFDEEAIVAKGQFQRYSFRVNIDQDLTRKLKIGTSSIIGFSKQDIGEYSLIPSIAMTPLGLAYEENGDLVVGRSPNFGNDANPILPIVGDSKNEVRRTFINPNFYLDFNILEGLSYRLNLGAGIEYERQGRFTSNIYNNLRGSRAWQTPTNSFQYTIENILNYSRDFGDHGLDLTALFSTQNSRFEWLTLNVQNLPYESQQFYNMGSAEEVSSTGSRLTEWGILSYMGRLQYSFKNRYLATLTMRADGSSRLSEGNKWDLFPSLALGWRMIDEPFMQNQNLFTELKIRASYGKIGNTGVTPYQTQGSLARSGYNFGNTFAFGYYPGEIANPKLGWEVTTTTNFGVDFGILNSRLTGSVEVYQQNTSDLLLNRQLPNSSGFSSVLENIGKTRNTGIEVAFNTVPIDISDGLRWESGITFFSNKEEIVELYAGKEDDIGNQWFIGEPINVWFDYEFDGIWQTDQSGEAETFNQIPGTIRVVDQNDDQNIDPDDRVIIGTPNPKWSGGWNNYFNYKGFDLSVQAYFRWGQTSFNEFHHILTQNAHWSQDESSFLDMEYWTPENPINSYPAPSKYDLNQKFSALNYFNGSFIKVRDITLGYNFKTAFNNIPFSNLKLYVSAFNALLIRKEKVPAITLDVEDDNGVLDTGEVPLPRVFLLGVNVGF